MQRTPLLRGSPGIPPRVSVRLAASCLVSVSIGEYGKDDDASEEHDGGTDDPSAQRKGTPHGEHLGHPRHRRCIQLQRRSGIRRRAGGTEYTCVYTMGEESEEESRV